MSAITDKLPDRWVMGLLAFFGTVFVANGVLIYLAVSTYPEIEQSYEERVGESPLAPETTQR